MANNDWAAGVLCCLQKLADSPSNSWEQAETYAALPLPSTCPDSTWLVLKGTGVWPFTNPAGWYHSDGSAWTYLGAYNPIVSGGNVVVDNFPAIQAVSGTVNIGNLPASQDITGTVSVSNFPATQPVTGTFWPATQPVSLAALPLPSGASTETTLAAIKAKTDNLDVLLSTRTKPSDSQTVTGSLSVSNFPATQMVSGTFWQATQPVSGPLTDVQLRLTPVAVSGTFWQAIQPVSGTFWQATQPISGAVSVSNFPATQPVSGTFWQATQPISGSVSVSNFPATQPVSGPLTDGQLRASAVPVSGTFFQATQPVSGPLTDAQLRASAVPVSGPVLTKGTQGANGLSVQNLKDAGRIYVSFTANAIAGVTTEALVSFSQNKQGAVTAGVTSYVVTSGKTLRITSVSFGLKSGAAAIAFAKLILRHNTAGATIATSPIAYLCPEINTNSAVLGTGAFITIPIPDGIEFFGNGTQTIGVSHLDQATTNVLTVTVHGFEY